MLEPKNFIILSSMAAVFSLFAGCASHLPPFQKASATEPGFTLEKSISSQAFVMKVDLKGHADAKYSVFYGYRAVGEECLARKFDYFDVAVIDHETFEGYCYAGSDHPGLAIEFSERGLDARPQKFLVDDLLGKTKTNLQKGDEIISIEDSPPRSVATFKAAVYRAASAGRTSIDLKVKRGTDELKIKEPIALFKNSSLGSTQLDLFRSRVK